MILSINTGIYQCAAENEAGSILSTTLLVVSQNDKHPRPVNLQCFPINHSTIYVTFDKMTVSNAHFTKSKNAILIKLLSLSTGHNYYHIHFLARSPESILSKFHPKSVLSLHCSEAQTTIVHPLCTGPPKNRHNWQSQ